MVIGAVQPQTFHENAFKCIYTYSGLDFLKVYESVLSTLIHKSYSGANIAYCKLAVDAHYTEEQLKLEIIAGSRKAWIHFTLEDNRSYTDFANNYNAGMAFIELRLSDSKYTFDSVDVRRNTLTLKDKTIDLNLVWDGEKIDLNALHAQLGWSKPRRRDTFYPCLSLSK